MLPEGEVSNSIRGASVRAFALPVGEGARRAVVLRGSSAGSSAEIGRSSSPGVHGRRRILEWGRWILNPCPPVLRGFGHLALRPRVRRAHRGMRQAGASRGRVGAGASRRHWPREARAAAGGRPVRVRAGARLVSDNLPAHDARRVLPRHRGHLHALRRWTRPSPVLHAGGWVDL